MCRLPHADAHVARPANLWLASASCWSAASSRVVLPIRQIQLPKRDDPDSLYKVVFEYITAHRGWPNPLGKVIFISHGLSHYVGST